MCEPKAAGGYLKPGGFFFRVLYAVMGKLFPDYAKNRPDDAWGAITVWAWAASRIMDYFETEPLIDETRVAVVGHSRGGKTALWCTAQDERFAMAVSSCAGNRGDALSRGSKGETVKDIADRFPYWFCRNYQKYRDNEDTLPFDQHMLLALIAPGWCIPRLKPLTAGRIRKGSLKPAFRRIPSISFWV